jgi:hypothetical protein
VEKEYSISGGAGNDGSNTINNIPVIPQMNFATTINGTTANVTIPVCNGEVGGLIYAILIGQILCSNVRLFLHKYYAGQIFSFICCIESKL